MGISGGLAIGGARSGNKCLIVATMVMSIISAVSAGVLIIISSFLTAGDMHWRCAYYDRACLGLVTTPIQIVMGLVMLVAATVSSALTCRATCCRSTEQGRVHYTSNHTHIQMPSLPTAMEQVDLPPAYHNVAGEGSKYQKF